MHPLGHATSKSCSICSPAAFLLTKDWGSYLFRGGTRVFSYLKKPQILLAIGSCLAIYYLYQRIVPTKNENSHRDPVIKKEHPSFPVVQFYVRTLQNILDGKEGYLSKATKDLGDNSSLTLEQVMEKLSLPKEIPLERLQLLRTSSHPLTQDVGRKLIEESFTVFCADQIQKVFDGKSNIQKIDLSPYAKEHQHADRVVQKLDAMPYPSLDQLKEFSKEAPSGVLKEIVDSIYQAQLEKAAVQGLLKFLSGDDDRFFEQHFQTLSEKFPQHVVRLKFQVFIWSISDRLDQLNLGRYQNLVEEIKVLLLQRDKELLWAKAIEKYLENPAFDEKEFAKLSNFIPSLAVIVARLNPLRIPDLQTLERLKSSHPTVQSVVHELRKHHLIQQVKTKCIEAQKTIAEFVEKPTFETALTASDALDRVQIAQKTASRSWVLDSDLLSDFILELQKQKEYSLEALMKAEPFAQGKLNKVVYQLLFFQCRKELILDFHRSSSYVEKFVQAVHASNDPELKKEELALEVFKHELAFILQQDLDSRIINFFVTSSLFAVRPDINVHKRPLELSGYEIQVWMKDKEFLIEDQLSTISSKLSWEDLKNLQKIPNVMSFFPQFDDFLETLHTLYISKVFQEKPEDRKIYGECLPYALSRGEEDSRIASLENLAMAHELAKNDFIKASLETTIRSRFVDARPDRLEEFKQKWSQPIRFDTPYHQILKKAFAFLQECAPSSEKQSA